MEIVIKVKKANKVLQINGTDLDYYLKNGWSQIDDSGRVLKENRATYTAAEYNKLKAEKDALQARVYELESGASAKASK